MKFNVNEYVRVKLTERGRQILLDEAAEFRREHPQVKSPHSLPKEDEEGWSKWQMWSLMQHFGPHIHLGFDPPFETEIDILVKESK